METFLKESFQTFKELNKKRIAPYALYGKSRYALSKEETRRYRKVSDGFLL